VDVAMMKQLKVADSPPDTAADFGPNLTESQLSTLRKDGFLLIEGLATREDAASLSPIYDRLFSERRGWDSGDLFDMVGRDNLERGLALPQLLWPSRYEPLLKQSKLALGAHRVARQILGPKVENILEHAIRKPPLTGAATPWHQDDAFNRRGSGFVEQISIWMPLQDVTVEAGCMQYIRGSNLGALYPHRSPNNDPRIHGLEMVTPPDMTHCAAVPMRAGDAVIHLSRTIHGAGPNTSDQPRRAYVLGYAVKERRDEFLTRDYPWNLEKQTARDERELRSLPYWKRPIHRVRRFLRTRKF
jgi:Phytanoyl-CoA dioxygenase (PhyH)